ncbi:hypothetical protein [Flavobacterium sp.]|uniref:hypothetical protein n=1 Tax=Flavobacterium sp. TaxID=239 RepID=UPI0025B88A6A|nr:hypothetical protein [Flavobacterium sp.]MBA4155397.1 hypothetical protein [Flavobacterium sp.]
MKKIMTFLMTVFISIAIQAQQKPKKSSTKEQSRSAETGRYVTKQEAKKNPSTTYTSKTRKKKS